MKSSNSNYRLVIGVIAWVAVAALLWLGFQKNPEQKQPHAFSQVSQFIAQPSRMVKVEFEYPQRVRYGDPVFWFDGDQYIRIGEVVRVESVDSTEMEAIECKTAYVRFYSRSPKLDPNDQLAYHDTPREIEWVVRMMLPPERRERIGQLITEAYIAHQKEIVADFRPIIENALRDAMPLIEKDLRKAFAKREDEFRKIGNRYREDIVKKDLIPLVENEIWPIVQAESHDLVDELGHEIWEKASLFRFGWRVLYDSTPLPKRDLTKKEFERFVRKDAVPVIQNHMDELIMLQERIIHKIANNKKVRKVVGETLMTIADDKEVQKLTAEIINEVFIKNRNLLNKLESHWKSEQAKKAMARTSERLEPTVAAIGEELFGNPEKQITPEFSRVLRYKILKKDARWFVLHQAEIETTTDTPVNTMKVVLGQGDTHNPFHVPR